MDQLTALTTPHLADTPAPLGLPLRSAPTAIKPIMAHMKCCRPARPVQHTGGVEIFSEALNGARPGDVIDDGGREDAACIGDLIVLEMQLAGIAGVMLRGRHRNIDDLVAIDLQIFSLGVRPNEVCASPLGTPDRLRGARIGDCQVTADEVVVAGGNSGLFLAAADVARGIAVGDEIRETERREVAGMRAGTSFRQQAAYDAFLAKRAADPDRAFRTHIQAVRNRSRAD